MEVSEVFGFIKDFGFPMVLSWFLLVRKENKLAGLTEVIGGAELQHRRPAGRNAEKTA